MRKHCFDSGRVCCQVMLGTFMKYVSLFGVNPCIPMCLTYAGTMVQQGSIRCSGLRYKSQHRLHRSVRAFLLLLELLLQYGGSEALQRDCGV